MRGRRLGVVLVLALLATACGGGGTAKTKDAAGKEAAPQQASIDPDLDVKVGLPADLYVTALPRANLGNNLNITETLVLLTPNYEVKPLLAESWELRAPNTWRFHLRHGVKFHDGQPLNADAVKKGLFDRLAAIPGGSTIKAGTSSAVVVDEFTVDFTPTVPNLRVVEQISHPQNGVVAPGTTLESKPVGTGPFRTVSYTPKETFVVDRNPDYWGDKAKAARITYRFIPDNSSRLLALRAGDIDIALDVPRTDVQGLKDGGFTVQNSAVGVYEAMYANIHGDPPFDILADLNVRKAVALGVDRKKLVDGVLDGLASQDQTIVPPGALGSHAADIKGFQFDPLQAKALLDQAGWKPGPDGMREKGGRKLKLTLVSGFPTAETHRPIPTFLQAELKTLGIDVEIVERPDSDSFYDLMKQKKGDLWLEQGNQNDANPGFLPALLFYTGAASSGTNETQGISAPGATFDALLDPIFTEPNLEKVQASVAAAVNQLVHNDVAVIPLAGIFRVYAMKKTVQGFVPHPSTLNLRWAGVGLTHR